MDIKSCFLHYVESHINANSIRTTYGVDDARTRDAYIKVNAYKRQMLDLIEANDELLAKLKK
jgi:hypothetical protein